MGKRRPRIGALQQDAEIIAGDGRSTARNVPRSCDRLIWWDLAEDGVSEIWRRSALWPYVLVFLPSSGVGSSFCGDLNLRCLFACW